VDRTVAGFELLPHTADIIVSAWASTAEGCIAEAVRGLVASFVDVVGAQPRRSVTMDYPPVAEEELLVRVLEDVVYLLDVEQAVPARAEVERAGEGGVSATFWLVPVTAGRSTGSVPKAITRHGLRFGRSDGAWRCTVTIDV
jgi:SHS2 domain-containing protein